MAVYERSFEPYDGEITPPGRRFLVLARYALKDAMRSKLFLVFFTACFIFPLLCLFLVYLRNNVDLLDKLSSAGIRMSDVVQIDETFFGVFMMVQGTLAFFLVLFSGPRLVSRDLANNGLALYLCRPFSKTQYVAGKLAVLAILTSAVTWVPGLLIWSVQTGLAGGGWAAQNLRPAAALLLGSWSWIFVLGLLALAISAWVKWRIVAGFLLLLTFFGGGVFAVIVDELFHSKWGYVAALYHNVRRIWAHLFGTTTPFFPVAPTGLSPWASWIALAVIAAISVYLLHRRIRAYEVVT